MIDQTPVSGLTGSGKSAVMREIEIALKALGLTVEHDTAFQAEKNATHAEWQDALDLYKPTVVLTERNVSIAPAPSSLAGGEVTMGRRAFEAMRDHNDNDAPLTMNSTQQWSDLSDREREKWDKDAAERPHLYGLGFAALSPEAPAREGEHKGFIWKNLHGQECIGWHLPPEFMRGSVIELFSALTPRHEAPAFVPTPERYYPHDHEAPASEGEA